MIAKRLGFTGDFLMEPHTELYDRLKKIPCGFSDVGHRLTVIRADFLHHSI
jgi:hypothetical protein